MTDLSSRDIRATSLILGAPLTNAAVFFLVVLVGCSYIIAAKLHGVNAALVTFGPVLIMLVYAALIGGARVLRLRDDQSGDNLYYMGFLFTLTSLGVSLYQFNTSGAAEAIVRNFGIAIASTIAGIALRVFFNQMRRDPIEVEATARLELAQAAVRVRRELDHTVLEFNQFRRVTQQMISDALAETKEKVDAVGAHLLAELEVVTKRSGENLEAASKQSRATLEAFAASTTATLDSAAKSISAGTHGLSDAASAAAVALGQVSSKLSEMRKQTIEIKLNPTLQGLSRAVNTFTKSTEKHASDTGEAIDAVKKVAQTSTALFEIFAGPAGIQRRCCSSRTGGNTARSSGSFENCERNPWPYSNERSGRSVGFPSPS